MHPSASRARQAHFRDMATGSHSHSVAPPQRKQVAQNTMPDLANMEIKPSLRFQTKNDKQLHEQSS